MKTFEPQIVELAADTLDDARRMVERMTIDDALAVFGLENETLPRDAYIYLDNDGCLNIYEKHDRTAYPADEHFSFGYVDRYQRSRDPGRPPLFGERMKQTAIHLPESQIDWLKAQPGGISQTIRELIEGKMNEIKIT